MELSQSDQSVIDKLVQHFVNAGVIPDEHLRMEPVVQDDADVDAMMREAASLARSEREIRPDSYAASIDDELLVRDSLEEDWKNPYED